MEKSATYFWGILVPLAKVIPSDSPSTTKMEYNFQEISKRNFQVRDVLLLKEEIGRNKWPMARIVSTEPDSCGIVQSVQLKVIDTSNNNIKLFRRPISKIVLLVENEHSSIPDEGSHVV